MARIVLKIDVDTLRGTREGVPNLARMLDRFKARARTASAAERPALWKTMAAIWPPYDEYQAKTSRSIPVVIIERA